MMDTVTKVGNKSGSQGSIEVGKKFLGKKVWLNGRETSYILCRRVHR